MMKTKLNHMFKKSPAGSSFWLPAITLASGIMMSSSASATQITQWSYFIESGFSAWTQVGPGVGPDIIDEGVGVDGYPTKLSWGEPFDAEGPRSYLEVSSPVEGDDLITNGVPVTSAVLTHGNNIIQGPSRHLLTADLLSTLTLKPFLPDGPPLDPQSVTFQIKFEETNNSSTNSELCGDGLAITPCDDVFVLLNPEDLVTSFVFGSYKYTLTVALAGLSNLNDAQCSAAGTGSGCVGLLTPEQQTSSFNATIGIASAKIPVPEPATLALLGLGMLGMGVVRRRKSVV
jgi:hypothetical protein